MFSTEELTKFKNKKTRKQCICWFDRLTLFSFSKLRRLNLKYEIVELRYMTIAPFVKTFIEKYYNNIFKLKCIFSAEGLISAKEEKEIDIKAYDDIVSLIYKQIRICSSNKYSSLLKNINPRYSREKISFFFEQEISREIENIVKLCNHVKSFCLNNKNLTYSYNLIIVTDNFWIPHIRSYYENNNIRLYTYLNFKEIISMFYYPIKIFIEIIANLFLVLIGKSIITKNSAKDSKVAVLYVQGANLEKKTDYFWYPNSGINPSKIILYFKYSVRSPNAEIIKFIEQNNITWVNLLPWKLGNKKYLFGTMELNRLPSTIYLKKSLKTLAITLRLFFYCLFKNDKIYFWYWKNLTILLNTVDFFESFFITYNIKVHFGQYEAGKDMSSANIAIELVKGIDIGTHWSNFDFVTVYTGKPYDVYFSWGQFFKDNFFDNIFYPIDRLVYSGYPYDSFFTRCKEKSKRYRSKLIDSGAEFIVSFFDQNCSDLRPGWTKGIEKMYKFLLKEVMDDKTMGLIIKPKKLINIEDKLPLLVGLLNQAIATGRCIVLEGDIFPCEAAYASDLAIGIGVSSTPVTEALISGVPGITFDPLSSVNHPLYKKGIGRVVFDDLGQMIQAIGEFRRNRHNKTNIGDFSFILKEIDAFRDGNASVRIGNFINWLLDAFDKGMGGQDAMEIAINRYRTCWGSDKVVDLKKEKDTFKNSGAYSPEFICTSFDSNK
ncbi:MAG: hypothetical protein PHS93_04480 [Candidatus Omnitrophica bacterium]|nr:hypothetical protein [Candidatus Omnitrophota bacterium]MDD5352407.1 hypothetical protein [Candidatus Omnitrophota bacterium]MDD5550005.1 hypothetical protein [Candidatus Omnitrophota bacterium]